jgi:hypothetical protein
MSNSVKKTITDGHMSLAKCSGLGTHNQEKILAAKKLQEDQKKYLRGKEVEFVWL